MIQEGLIVAIAGMGTVFIFLTLLVFSMALMGKIIIWLNKVMPEEVKETVKVPNRNNNVDEEIAVAIAVAKMNMN